MVEDGRERGRGCCQACGEHDDNLLVLRRGGAATVYMHVGCVAEGRRGMAKRVAISEPRKETVCGTLDKFSIGRANTFKNWRTRHFVADAFSIQYFKNKKDALPQGRIPFNASTRLRTAVSPSQHPQATKPACKYLLLDFDEDTEHRQLLLRFDDPSLHNLFATFLATFLPLCADGPASAATGYESSPSTPDAAAPSVSPSFLLSASNSSG